MNGDQANPCDPIGAIAVLHEQARALRQGGTMMYQQADALESIAVEWSAALEAQTGGSMGNHNASQRPSSQPSPGLRGRSH
jgi:hypothetical protein